jgi:hypothetical protein
MNEVSSRSHAVCIIIVEKCTTSSELVPQALSGEGAALRWHQVPCCTVLGSPLTVPLQLTPIHAVFRWSCCKMPRSKAAMPAVIIYSSRPHVLAFVAACALACTHRNSVSMVYCMSHGMPSSHAKLSAGWEPHCR